MKIGERYKLQELGHTLDVTVCSIPDNQSVNVCLSKYYPPKYTFLIMNRWQCNLIEALR